MENSLLDQLARTANLLCHCQIVLAGTSGYGFYENQGRLKKSGIFGFEGEVLFADPGIEWISGLVVFACHTVLRSLPDKQSPIFWKNSPTPVVLQINTFLVDLFLSLLSDVEKMGVQDNKEPMKSMIAREIDRILSR